MIIGVFGLPRSGTNYMEWTLKNNFIDVIVPHIDFKTNDVEPYIPKIIHTKHCYPTLDAIDGCIVIYKEFEEWKHSLERFKKNMFFPYTFNSWESYLNTANRLDKEKCIIVEHSWCVNNYERLLSDISSKFGVKIVDNLTIPTKIIDMGGNVTNKLYK